MKVLFVTPYLAPSYGGTSKVVSELAKRLGDLHLEVDIVSTNANNGNTLNVDLQTWLHHNSHHTQYFPTWHRSDLILSPSLIQWLIRHIQEYDIIHTHTLFAPLISFTHNLCRFHKIPYIITPHGMLDPWALAYKAWKKQLYYTRFERPALKNASIIQVLTTAEAEQVNKLGFDQTAIIPNGIDPKDFATLPNSEMFYQQYPHLRGKKLILFLGRIDPKKGLNLLAPAFAKIHTTFPNTHLIIAGPDSIGFTPTVQSYFAKAKCLDAVTFTGMLTGPIKYAVLAVADLYVAPSYSEGFSISVLEGMASGLPCIITTGCNFPESASVQAAHIVNADAVAIADALIHCLQHPEEAKAMGARARQFIFEHYTWNQIASNLMQVYQTILDKQPLPGYA